MSRTVVHYAYELLMLRRGVLLRVPGCDISDRACKTAISYLCNGWQTKHRYKCCTMH